MNKDKATAVIYKDWASMILELEPEQAGELFQSIYKYWNGDEINLSASLRPIFKFIIDQIEKNDAKYEDTLEKRRQAGQLGGLAKASKSKQMLANASKDNQTLASSSKAKQSLHDNVNVNVNVNDNVSTNVDIKERDSKESPKKTTSRFLTPSLSEVSDYCKERNNDVDPQTFIDFYSSKGWKVGNQPMKDWRAAVRTWEKRENRTPKTTAAPNGVSPESWAYIESLGG